MTSTNKAALPSILKRRVVPRNNVPTREASNKPGVLIDGTNNINTRAKSRAAPLQQGMETNNKSYGSVLLLFTFGLSKAVNLCHGNQRNLSA